MKGVDEIDWNIVKTSGLSGSKGSDTPSKEIEGNLSDKILIFENDFKKALKGYTRYSLIYYYYKQAFLKVCQKEYEPLIQIAELSTLVYQTDNPITELIKENKSTIVQNPEDLKKLNEKIYEYALILINSDFKAIENKLKTILKSNNVIETLHQININILKTNDSIQDLNFNIKIAINKIQSNNELLSKKPSESMENLILKNLLKYYDLKLKYLVMNVDISKQKTM